MEMTGESIIRARLYRPPHGMPLMWSQDPSGKLQAAVSAYLEFVSTTGVPVFLDGETLALVRAYVHYFVGAPCWTLNENHRKILLYAVEHSTTPEALSLLISRAMDLFDALSQAFTPVFTVFKASTLVKNVLGMGPIPTFAPPFVPVGPVVCGVGNGPPGCLA